MKEYYTDNRQKAMRLMEALSGVDGALLERSEGTGKVIPFWRYGKQLAACFALVVMGACAFGAYSVTNVKNDAGGKTLSFIPLAANENALSDGRAGASADMVPTVPYEKEAAEAPMGTFSPMEEGQAAANSAAGMKAEGFTDGLQMETATKSQDTNRQDTNNQAANADQAEACLQDARQEITLQAAKEMDRIGGYVPEKLPPGYRFESARGNSPDNSYLDMSLCFSKGMDDIRLHITEFYVAASMPPVVYDAFQKRIVNPARPETYDVNQYEIPYADTVPMEYFEVFHTPVFKEPDFSLEMVKARMKSVPDAGDTDTPRGNFAVLYDSGILVEFTGRGSAEEIWEMFESIQP